VHRFVFLSIVCALVLGACGSSRSLESRVPTPAGAVVAARAYVDAFNRRDGQALCEAWTAPVRHHITTIFAAMRVRGCAARVAPWIGYAEDVGMGGWTHARILAAGPARLSGSRAQVAVVERHFHRPGGDDDQTVRDVIQLVHEPDGWHVARPGLIFYAAVGAAQIPDTALDPPAAGTATGSRLPAPRFACPAPRLPIEDPLGDVVAAAGQGQRRLASPRPWLDIRRVALSDAPGATCVAIQLAATPRPDTRIVFTAHQPTRRHPGEFRVTGATVRVDGLGRAHATTTSIAPTLLTNLGSSGPAPRYGALGSTVYLLISETQLAHRTFQWQASVASTQADDPNVAHPALGGDTVPSTTPGAMLTYRP
jgi:hypothetical protein